MSDKKVYSFYHWQKKVKANNTTVKNNCAFLRMIGLIKIDEVSYEESASGIPSYRVTIAEDGLKAVVGLTE
ncbi:MAG: hypothetical protein EF813_09160 [Methanosarcinales archaeon]|nr:MAG: hypothetical protein EF813_09160 [Methanosarcinales archaeon]